MALSLVGRHDGHFAAASRVTQLAILRRSSLKRHLTHGRYRLMGPKTQDTSRSVSNNAWSPVISQLRSLSQGQEEGEIETRAVWCLGISVEQPLTRGVFLLHSVTKVDRHVAAAYGSRSIASGLDTSGTSSTTCQRRLPLSTAK